MGPGFESQPDHKAVSEMEQFFYFWHMAFMYIIYSNKLNKYYIGACIDLKRRLYEHNIGHSKFTSTGVPWMIVYKEEFENLPIAKKRELEIKRMKSRKYIEKLAAQ